MKLTLRLGFVALFVRRKGGVWEGGVGRGVGQTVVQLNEFRLEIS